MRSPLLIALLLCSGCYPFRRVHQEHVDAWAGRSLAELENHPEWGVPDEVGALDEHRKVYVYLSCRAAHGSDGQYYGERCCKDKFVIQDQRIVKYDASDGCYTTDRSMPVDLQPVGFQALISKFDIF